MKDDTTDSEEPYFCFSASLRISGQIPDPDQISSRLGLCPTLVRRRVYRAGPKYMSLERDLWIYQAPVDENFPLAVHIATLWHSIRAHRDYLVELKRNCNVEVFCGYRSNSRHAGFEVPAESLEMFIQLNIPFGVSVIVL